MRRHCLIVHSHAGVHRSQAPSSGRRKEPKPCNALKAANTTVAWAPKASEITDAYNSSSTSLADVAEELLRSDRRSPKHENSSPSAGRLQEQLAVQLEIALKAQENFEVRTRPSHAEDTRIGYHHSSRPTCTVCHT